MIPGEQFIEKGEIELNRGADTLMVLVRNVGDRPIQIGSHAHFYEVNDALEFDRAKAYGFRLNVPAGTALRFEPGESREVELVAVRGDRIVFGMNARVNGPLGGKAL
ncbi:MAG: urease subunit beta [Bryobacterales bacterium]